MSRILSRVVPRHAVVSLGMYDDSGELGRANDVLVRELARRLEGHGVARPSLRLDRERSLSESIADPNLLLGQVCGLPFAEKHRAYCDPIATPNYLAPGCDGTHHRSFVIVNSEGRVRGVEDLGPRLRIAINSPCSNTGRSLLADALFRVTRPERLTGARVIETGSHEGSFLAVARGDADIAAIDCVTYAKLSKRYPAEHASAKLILASRSVPAPPFVTSKTTSRELQALLFECLKEIFSDPALGDELAPLGIGRVSRLPAEAYDGLPELRRRADEAFGRVQGRRVAS